MKAVKNFSSEREIEDDALHRWFLESGSEEALSLLIYGSIMNRSVLPLPRS